MPMGYSQGGGVSGAVAEIADNYAPEINLKAATIGGLPSDLPVVLDNIDGTFLIGVVAYAAKVLMDVHPDVRSLGVDSTEWTTTGQTMSELFLSNPAIREILCNHKLGKNAQSIAINLTAHLRMIGFYPAS